MRDQKTYIYLDQCVVSRLLDRPSNVSWLPVRELLFRGNAQQRIVCPYSLEHLVESSSMHEKDAIAADDILRQLSLGYSILPEPDLIAAQINAVLRDTKLGAANFLHPIPFKPLSDPNVFAAHQSRKGDLDRFNDNLMRGVNQFNALFRGPRPSRETLPGLLTLVKQKHTRALRADVQNAIRDGAITITARHDIPGVPTVSSSVVYRLFETHQIQPAELVMLDRFLSSAGVLFIPFYQVKVALEACRTWQQQNIEPGDQYDDTRIACALPFVDILITDGSAANTVREVNLDRFFGVKVFSTKDGERSALIAALTKAVDPS